MSFMSKLFLDSVTESKIHVPQLIDICFDANCISAALIKQLSGGITGKQGSESLAISATDLSYI